MQMPKYNIGQTVINLVSKRGSYEPSVCDKYEKMTIDKVERSGSTFIYTCGYDGYRFNEDEIMTVEEYKRLL